MTDYISITIPKELLSSLKQLIDYISLSSDCSMESTSVVNSNMDTSVERSVLNTDVITSKENTSVETSIENTSDATFKEKKNDKEKVIEKEREEEKNLRVGKNGEIEFTPPSLQDVVKFCAERASTVRPNKFWEYYNKYGWRDKKGNLVIDWKEKLIEWEGREYGYRKPAVIVPAKKNYTEDDDLDRLMGQMERLHGV